MKDHVSIIGMVYPPPLLPPSGSRWLVFGKQPSVGGVSVSSGRACFCGWTCWREVYVANTVAFGHNWWIFGGFLSLWVHSYSCVKCAVVFIMILNIIIIMFTFVSSVYIVQSPNQCWFVVGVPKSRVYTRAYEWSRTHVKDLVVQVRVRWITETQKKPACTCKSG